MANLLLHQGSSFVGRAELCNVFTPPPTHSWIDKNHNLDLHLVKNLCQRGKEGERKGEQILNLYNIQVNNYKE